VAVIGSTLMARQAGIKLPAMVINSDSRIAEVKTVRLAGLTP
jgi:hypothetical protein